MLNQVLCSKNLKKEKRRKHSDKKWLTVQMLRLMKKAEGQNPQNVMEESESSRALLNPRSPWTTAIPGASLAEMEHTGTVSLCWVPEHPLWASLWAPTAAHPLLTSGLDCFPPFSHTSLAKSVSQAFSAQAHHCPSLQPPQASPGSVWNSCTMVAFAGCSQVSTPGSPMLLPSPSTPEAPRMLQPFCHIDLNMLKFPFPSLLPPQRLFLPHLKHLKLQGASSQQSPLFVS